ncbi:hypothetical protein [Parendozoicomonas haliclonae]|uniref:hypothetical protein n=1 Tax=Parendozoicomonas haliclonae TaxID=1960125 RepID=UPI00105547CF|nr:hypothetical protein [Parendozoicomonas haliclonae]
MAAKIPEIRKARIERIRKRYPDVFRICSQRLVSGKNRLATEQAIEARNRAAINMPKPAKMRAMSRTSERFFDFRFL